MNSLLNITPYNIYQNRSYCKTSNSQHVQRENSTNQTNLASQSLPTQPYYINFRGKNLVKQIHFIPAKTIEEASNFAIKKLGFSWDRTSQSKDIDLLNFVNLWLADGINTNRFKKLKPTHGGILNEPYNYGIFCASKYGFMNIILANKYEIQRCTNLVANLKSLHSTMFEFDKEVEIAIVDNNYDIPFVKDFVNKLNQYRNNPDKFSIMDKLQILTDWKIIENSPIVNGKLEPIKISIFNWLNHEYAHLLHEMIEKNYAQMCKPSESNGVLSSVTKEFLENPEIQRIAESVTKYAKESPREFVAEVYAGMCDGNKYSDKVMALYRKYGGPESN